MNGLRRPADGPCGGTSNEIDGGASLRFPEPGTRRLERAEPPIRLGPAEGRLGPIGCIADAFRALRSGGSTQEDEERAPMSRAEGASQRPTREAEFTLPV